MTKKVTAPMAAGTAISPRSDVTVLVYVGGAALFGAPGRDLHGGDLARIARLRAVEANPAVGVTLPTAATLQAIADELTASGVFRPVGDPAPSVALTPTTDPTPEPTEPPAETTEA